MQALCDAHAGNAAVRAVVQVTSEEQWFHLQALAMAHSWLGLLLIRPNFAKGALVDGEELKEIPERARGRQVVCIRQVALRSFGDGPRLKLERTTVGASAVTPTTVLRLSSEEKYAPETWAKVTKAPGAVDPAIALRRARSWSR